MTRGEALKASVYDVVWSRVALRVPDRYKRFAPNRAIDATRAAVLLFSSPLAPQPQPQRPTQSGSR